MNVYATPQGELKYLYSEELDLTLLGDTKINRASNVEWYTDRGEPGWYAEIGAMWLGPYKHRSLAILAEIDFLNSQFENTHDQNTVPQVQAG